MTTQEKIAKLKTKLKTIRKRYKELEEEQAQYYRFEEIEELIYNLTDEAEDIKEDISRLRKKK